MIRVAGVLVIASCATSSTPIARPVPVIPPIVDKSIVFGQRVGPISLGMTEAQLDGVGEHTKTDYGDGRFGYIFKLGIHATMDHGVVISVAPDTEAYVTSTGAHVLGPVADLDREPTKLAKQREQNGVLSWCYADGTFVTSATTGSAVCGAGKICDIVVGGCQP